MSGYGVGWIQKLTETIGKGVDTLISLLYKVCIRRLNDNYTKRYTRGFLPCF